MAHYSGGGVGMNARKGKRNERKLVRWFRENGWYAQRTGASGSSTDMALPDVVAASCGEIYMIELKSWQSGTGQVPKEQIEQLRRARELSGGRARVVVWPDLRKSEHDGRYVFELGELHENEQSFSVRKSDLDEATVLDEIV